MATTITWSIEAHKHETSGKKFISNCSYVCAATESSYRAEERGNAVLDRPSDSDMVAYATFLKSGSSVLVNAVKAKLGDTKVAEIEKKVTDQLALVKTPTHVWTTGDGSS